MLSLLHYWLIDYHPRRNLEVYLVILNLHQVPKMVFESSTQLLKLPDFPNENFVTQQPTQRSYRCFILSTRIHIDSYANHTHFCSKVLLNSSMVAGAGFRAAFELPRTSHMYSMGLRSGDIAGYSYR
ncbi:hypothetical protein TNCV_2867541 [Trichonephila clavipes]|nr:hypothetical protein TNCV_2867541 [Trichonephila clavipes]